MSAFRSMFCQNTSPNAAVANRMRTPATSPINGSETAVTTTLSVFIGYLIATLAIVYIQSVSKAAAQYFYYPLWMKLLVLAFLYAICLFSGTISVRKVLRKTPAEILAKYDI